MNKNDRVRLRCRPLSSLDEDLKGVGLKCVPGRCHCHLYGNDQGPSLHNPDWTPHMEAMLKVMPAERPFHKALVLLDKQLSRVRAATGKFIKQNALAARVIPRALQPLEIGELDPVMLGVGLGIARLAAPPGAPPGGRGRPPNQDGRQARTAHGTPEGHEGRGRPA